MTTVTADTTATTITPVTSVPFTVSTLAYDELAWYECDFDVSNTRDLGVDDYIYYQFPAPFTNWDDTVEFQITGVTTTTPTVQVYPNERLVSIKINNVLASGIDKKFRIYVHNPSYEDSSNTYNIEVWATVGGMIYDKIVSNDIWTFNYTPALLNGGNINVPSEFSVSVAIANTVNITIEPTFTITPKLEAGSSIELTLPAEYPTMSASSPAVTCSVLNLTATCTISTSSNSAEITGFAELARYTEVQMQIVGIKNPTSFTNLSDFTVSFKNSSGKAVGNDTIAPGYNIAVAEAVGTISLILRRDLISSGVPSTYTISSQLGKALYVGSIIKITFPSNFDVLTNAFECHLTGEMTQYASATATSNSEIQIVLS